MYIYIYIYIYLHIHIHLHIHLQIHICHEGAASKSAGQVPQTAKRPAAFCAGSSFHHNSSKLASCLLLLPPNRSNLPRPSLPMIAFLWDPASWLIGSSAHLFHGCFKPPSALNPYLTWICSWAGSHSKLER